MKNLILAVSFILTFSIICSAQTNQPAEASNQTVDPAQSDPLQNISQQISVIAKSVKTLNAGIKDLLEKFAVGKGMQLSDRQQKLLLGYEVLNRAEQRLEILQKFQIELTQKDGEVKSRIAQVEEELIPGSIERSTAFTGTTHGDELRDGRKKTLETERRNLQTLNAQIARNLQQNSDEMRQAENFVSTLRRKILPALETEVSDL